MKTNRRLEQVHNSVESLLKEIFAIDGPFTHFRMLPVIFFILGDAKASIKGPLKNYLEEKNYCIFDIFQTGFSLQTCDSPNICLLMYAIIAIISPEGLILT